jgi:hypothetical protein
MPESKHQPPSRRRYAATHPTIGVHCDQKTYEDLIALRERYGLSFGQFVRQALGKVAMDAAKVEEVGRARGYRQAKALYCLTSPCIICGQPIEIRAGSEMAHAAVRAVNDWEHTQCP